MTYKYNSKNIEHLSKNIFTQPLEEILELEPEDMIHFIHRLMFARKHKPAKEAADYLVKGGMSEEDISRRLSETFYLLCCRDREGARNVASVFDNGYGFVSCFKIYTGEDI